MVHHEFIPQIWWNDSIPRTSINYWLVKNEVMMDQPIPFHSPNKKSEWRDNCHGGQAAGSRLGTRMVSSCMGTCGQQACRSPRRLVAERANVIKAINNN